MKEWIKKHKMSLFVMIAAVVMLIGLSYAWLQITLRGEKELTLTSGTLRLVLDDSMDGGITMDSAVPVTDEKGKPLVIHLHQRIQEQLTVIIKLV